MFGAYFGIGFFGMFWRARYYRSILLEETLKVEVNTVYIVYFWFLVYVFLRGFDGQYYCSLFTYLCIWEVRYYRFTRYTFGCMEGYLIDCYRQ